MRRKHKRHYLAYYLLLVLLALPFYFLQIHITAEVRTKTAHAEEIVETAEQKIQRLEAEDHKLREQVADLTQQATLPLEEKMAHLIKAYFPEDTVTALAVFKHESGLKPDRMNWNCYYGDKSTSCKPEDRAKAWSVDCGLTMINQIGQVCPKELFDPEINLQRARAKYDNRGWQPWVAWWNDSFRQSLDWAGRLAAKI